VRTFRQNGTNTAAWADEHPCLTTLWCSARQAKRRTQGREYNPVEKLMRARGLSKKLVLAQES